jgi:hypothetical protein
MTPPRLTVPALTLGVFAWAGAAPECANSLDPAEAWTWPYLKRPAQALDAAAVVQSRRYELRRVVVSGGYSDEYRSGDKLLYIQQYRCQAGAHTNVSKLNFGSGITVTKVEASGLNTPAAGAWTLGATWSRILDLEGRKGLLSGSGRIASRYRIVGREQVSVPAGTFTA